MKEFKTSKPDISKLKNGGYTLIDMHIHSDASDDCQISLQDILKRAKKLGIGIAITDHDKIDSAIAGLNNKLGVVVIPGIEVSAKNYRHVLFYFYSKKELVKFYNNEVKNKILSKTANELISLKDKYECIVGLAHPTGYKYWHNFNDYHYFKKLDFLETINTDCSKTRSLKSYQWVLKYKKGMTAGSDSHKLSKIGRGVVCSKGKTIKGVLESIKRRETLVRGLPLSYKEQFNNIPHHLLDFALLVKSFLKDSLNKIAIRDDSR